MGHADAPVHHAGQEPADAWLAVGHGGDQDGSAVEEHERQGGQEEVQSLGCDAVPGQPGMPRAAQITPKMTTRNEVIGRRRISPVSRCTRRSGCCAVGWLTGSSGALRSVNAVDGFTVSVRSVAGLFRCCRDHVRAGGTGRRGRWDFCRAAATGAPRPDDATGRRCCWPGSAPSHPRPG